MGKKNKEKEGRFEQYKGRIFHVFTHTKQEKYLNKCYILYNKGHTYFCQNESVLILKKGIGSTTSNQQSQTP